MGSSSEKSSEVLDCINLEVFLLLLNEEFLLLDVFDLTLVKLDPLVLLVSSLLKRAGLAPDKSIPLTFTWLILDSILVDSLWSVLGGDMFSVLDAFGDLAPAPAGDLGL